jgi:hypothetical protein
MSGAENVELPAKNPLADDEEKGNRKRKKSAYFKSFKPYDERSCSDILCLLLMLFFVVLWIVLLAVAFVEGKPEVLYRATDYHGNICGSEAAATTKDGEFPVNLKAARVGVMPRLIDDFILEAKRTTENMAISMPVVTTMCAEECPKSGAVFCDYSFLQRMASEAGEVWATNPLVDTKPKEPKTQALRILQKTATENRALIKINPALENVVKGKCLMETEKPVGYTKSAFDFCMDVYFSCDRIIVDTKPILGRCVPDFADPQVNLEQRCVDPVKATNCTTTKDFDVECIPNDLKAKAGSPGRTAVVTPKVRGDGLGTEFSDEDKKRCSKIQKFDRTITEDIPQMAILESIIEAASSFSRYVTAVQKAWVETTLCGLFMPMIVGFVFLLIIGKFARCIVWISIILLEACFIAGSLIFLQKAGVIQLPGQATSTLPDTLAPVDPAQSQYYQIAGWVFTLFAVIFFCVVLFLRSTIVDAIRVIRISAKAVTKNCSILLWPLVSFFCIGVVSALFCMIGVLLMSSGEMIQSKIIGNSTDSMLNNTGVTDVLVMKTEDTIKYLGLFDLFMWVWLCEFIQAIGIFTIGGDVAEWYFTDTSAVADANDDEDGAKGSCCDKCKNNGGVCGAFCHTMRLHAGTAAFGALVLAIIKFIKWWIQLMVNEIQKANGENKCLKYILMCVMCIVHCFERCIKYLSKNAYLYSTIRGTSFCWSAYKSFVLLWNNFARFGATGISSAVIMLFGKLAIMMTSTLAVYYSIEYNSDYQNIESENNISNMGQFFITFVVLCMSYVVAEIFFGVYNIATDSIMICYCFDVEDGNGEAFAQKMGFELDIKKTKEEDAEGESGGITCCACLPCCKKGKTDTDE